jgi:hypothetical protein
LQILALNGEWEKARMSIDSALGSLERVDQDPDANDPIAAFAHSSQTGSREAETLVLQSLLLQLTVGLHLGHEVSAIRRGESPSVQRAGRVAMPASPLLVITLQANIMRQFFTP